MKSKVRGMMLGVAVGDALGMPVETWGQERIKSKYPNGILKYETPDLSHKWFSGYLSGITTDDTQLTMAVMKGMIEGNGFNLDTIAKAQAEAMGQSTLGWGDTTREAIERIRNGVSWGESGKTSDPTKGNGNGVLMKLAPLAAYRASLSIDGKGAPFNFHQLIEKFSSMTHYTTMAAHSAVLHTNALFECLMHGTGNYDVEMNLLELVPWVYDCGMQPLRLNYFEVSHLNLGSRPDDCLEGRLLGLRDIALERHRYSFDWIANEYGGSCYIYDSLPYVYAHWIKNHNSVQTLYNSINYGIDRNDTDSNASMLGAMLGALHGEEIFQDERHLIDGLKCYGELMELTDKFCETFGITGEE